MCQLSLFLCVCMCVCVFAFESPGNSTGAVINTTEQHDRQYWSNYLVCAPCRCSRTLGRSPGRAAASLAPCVASYPRPRSGTTPGRWGSSEHTWSPPADVHIRCCWWRKPGDHTQQRPKSWLKRWTVGFFLLLHTAQSSQHLATPADDSQSARLKDFKILKNFLKNIHRFQVWMVQSVLYACDYRTKQKTKNIGLRQFDHIFCILLYLKILLLMLCNIKKIFIVCNVS